VISPPTVGGDRLGAKGPGWRVEAPGVQKNQIIPISAAVVKKSSYVPWEPRGRGGMTREVWIEYMRKNEETIEVG